MQMEKQNHHLSGVLEQNQTAVSVTLEVLHLSHVNKTDATQYSYLRSPPAETCATFTRQIVLLSVRVTLKNKVRRRENERWREYCEGVREEGSHSTRPRSLIFHSADHIWILWKECLCLPYHALFWGITCAVTPQWRWSGSLPLFFTEMHNNNSILTAATSGRGLWLSNPFKDTRVRGADLSNMKNASESLKLWREGTFLKEMQRNRCHGQPQGMANNHREWRFRPQGAGRLCILSTVNVENRHN